MDKEPLSFSNNASGSLSLSWLISSGSCILRGVKLLLNCRRITNKNAVSLIVFSYTFSLSNIVFRYQFLRRVRVRSIPPNKSESSSWLSITRSDPSPASGQLNLPRSNLLAQLQRPDPSQYRILSLFLLALANKNRCPVRTSSPSLSRTIP
jgi:hypothetical protein